jgi:hypothetical protein
MPMKSLLIAAFLSMLCSPAIALGVPKTKTKSAKVQQPKTLEEVCQAQTQRFLKISDTINNIPKGIDRVMIGGAFYTKLKARDKRCDQLNEPVFEIICLKYAETLQNEIALFQSMPTMYERDIVNRQIAFTIDHRNKRCDPVIDYLFAWNRK